MSARPCDLTRRFSTQRQRTLEAALAQRIGEEFPRIGGPRIVDLCARLIMEIFEQHVRPHENISHGQILWAAVAADDPPARGKRITQTNLRPVILDLATAEDVDGRIERESKGERLMRISARLCCQAHAQGALLSNADLAMMLNVSDTEVARAVCGWEQKHQKLLPRRATLHDVGSGLTHKRIICWKRYVEGKQSHDIARETHHSMEAVDRYLGQFERVRCCKKEGLSREAIAFALRCSGGLVDEYLEIVALLEKKAQMK